MQPEHSKQLDAYLDGELSASERQAVERWLASDPEASAELERLRDLRVTVSRFDPDLPDIEEEWQQLASKLETGAGAEEAGSGRRSIIPFPAGFGAAAAALMLGLLLWFALPREEAPRQAGDALNATVEMVETDLENSSSIVYIDPESGWTVVWVEEAG